MDTKGKKISFVRRFALQDKVTAVFVALILPLALQAKDYEYEVCKGGKCVSVCSCSIHGIDNGYVLVVSWNGRVNTQVLDSGFKTLKMTIREDPVKTNVTVVKKGKDYYMKGVLKGKSVDKVVKGDGYPWYQNIQFAIGHVCLTDGKVVYYENFRPDNMEKFTMSATVVGDTEKFSKPVKDIRVSPKGALSKFWHCNYYINRETGEFVSYSGLEGLPGSDEVIWVPRKK